MCAKFILTGVAIVGFAAFFSLLTLVPMGRSLASARGIKRLLLRTVLTASLIFFAYFAVLFWPRYVYSLEQEAAYKLISQLRERRPVTVDSEVWEAATGRTITAYVNVCFSDKHVTFSELKRFRADVESCLAGQVDLATTDWIWKRLGETGPHGERYREKFERLYREDVYGSQ